MSEQEQALALARWEDQHEVSRKFRFNFKNFWLGRAEDGTSIGYGDDRHICLVSGSRGGKGTSVIVNNLCFWPGSAVVIDPKGENATITAARRGQGNHYCEGMGQHVIVLDPFKAAKVDDLYRSSFNPLDALDPTDERCIDDAARIANALVVVREDSKDPFFDESARSLVKALILHVLTAPEFDEDQRTLSMIHDLLKRGDWRIAQAMQDEGETEVSGHKALFQSMELNDAFEGVVAGNGSRYLAMLQNAPKTFDNVLQAALINTEFLDSPGMRRVVRHSSFDLSQLKNDPRGVSLYLSLPQDYMDTHYRWLRLMVMLTIAAMQKPRPDDPDEPQTDRPITATGHPTLFVLDEFAGLKRMPAIENAVAQLAGFGVKLFFVLQSLEQLKAAYKDNWETFLSNAGLKIFFSIEDHFTRKYVSDLMGMAEIIRSTESESQGTSETESVATGTSRTESRSSGTSRSQNSSRTEGTSDTVNTGRNWGTSRSQSEGENWGENWGESEGVSESKNWSRGGSSGVSYRESSSFFGLFKAIDTASVTYSSGTNFSFGGSTSTNFNRSKGGSRGGSTGTTSGTSEGRSDGRSQGRSEGVSHGESFSTTDGVSHGTSESETRTQGMGRSSTTSRNQGIHQRPLLRPEEFGKLFARVDDKDHEAFPGFALVLINAADPLVVRRCNYFDDAQFIDWFIPHPNHKFDPAVSVQIGRIRQFVDKLVAAATPVSGEPEIGVWRVARQEVVASGDVLFDIDHVPRDGRKIHIHAPCDGKAMMLSSLASLAAFPGELWPNLDTGQLFLLKHYPGKGGRQIDPIAELRDACDRLDIVPEPERPLAESVKSPPITNPWPALLLALLSVAIVAGVVGGIWWAWSTYPAQTLWTVGIVVGVPAVVALVIGVLKLSKWLDYEHDIEAETQWKAVGVLAVFSAIGGIVWLTVHYWGPIVEFIKAVMGFALVCVVIAGLAKLFGKKKTSA